MNILGFTGIYLIIGALIYLWSYYLYKKKIGEVPQYYSHPFVVVLILLTWPVLLFTSISKNIRK